MKPSEIIQKNSIELMRKNNGLRDLQKLPDNETKVSMVALIGYATQIQAIMNYLDEEYEKNKTPEQRQLEQASFSTSSE